MNKPPPSEGWLEPLKRQVSMLKGPLILTAILFVVAVAFVYFVFKGKSGQLPPIVAAPAPAELIRNVVFFKEGDEYAMYFSLYDAANREVARPGKVQLKLSQLGSVGITDGPKFETATVLLDASFEAGLDKYRWMEIEGGLFFSRHRLIIPQRIPADVLKKAPRRGAKGRIEIEFTDAQANTRVKGGRDFFFP